MSEKTEMKYLEERNQKIIDAVIKKANIVCPGALALIGINGSFMTGDFYEKSDLDLLILLNDDRGRQLECVFIQDDLQVGHDIYCTTWKRLQKDARYEHPNISKLMDVKIVYCADEKYKQYFHYGVKRAYEGNNICVPQCEGNHCHTEENGNRRYTYWYLRRDVFELAEQDVCSCGNRKQTSCFYELN